MRNRKSAKGSRKLRLVVIGVCLGLTVAVLGAPVCKTYRLEVPDPTELKLKDGEHVIASTPTPDGNLEVRVAVRGGVPSRPLYFIGGRRLDETSESSVPPEIRECLKGAQRAQADTFSYRGLSGSLERPAVSRVGTMAYPKGTHCVVLSSGCTKNYCYATVCCELASGTFACAYRSAHIAGTPY